MSDAPARTRDEHLAWCKQRALEYLDATPPDRMSALCSMVSDLEKHPDTATTIERDLTLAQSGIQTLVDHDTPALRRWIDGFR